MKKAVCPGSFCPVTNGHIDILRRAAELFDEVIVLVMTNPDKHYDFTTEQRCKMIESAIAGDPRIKVDSWGGLLAEYVEQNEVKAIVKGLRSATDFDYEFQMALTNKKLNPQVETLFLTTATKNMYLSSSMVKQIASMGGDMSSFVPAVIRADIMNRIFVKKDTTEE